MHAVNVENLGKRFRPHNLDRTWTFQERVMQGLRRPAKPEAFWALRNVSFTVENGQAIGIIGRNGAGKSTLLRLLGGIGRPDEGKAKVDGRVSGLLELGAGFHSDLTGRENIFICGVIGGLTRKEVAQRLEAIVNFSELEGFLDSPLRTYSNGMSMRLAFSIAIHTNPGVLLVDEVLSVGDLAFQLKCLDRIKQLKRDGSSIVVVSHDAGLVRTICDDALWIHAGKTEAYGPAGRIADLYVSALDQRGSEALHIRA
jgi:lipopolysaccharide transport system ATP-binding protein